MMLSVHIEWITTNEKSDYILYLACTVDKKKFWILNRSPIFSIWVKL